MTYKKIAKALMGLGFVSGVVATGSAYASAFQLSDQSAAQLGTAYAGGAAIADDASTEWYNPAGMVRIDSPELSAGAIDIYTHIKFNGTVSGSAVNTGAASAGGQNYVPNIHFVMPLNQSAWLGLGINTPFGLKTDYDESSIMAEYATLTSLKTIDFTPSLGVALTPKFSVGFGLDYEYLQAQFDDVAFDNTDYFDHNKMSDTAWGFHTGMLYQFTQQSRIGLMYHSAISHYTQGTGDLEGGLSSTGSSPSMPLQLPSMTTLSYFQGITDRWSMMTSLSYVTWKSVQDFQVSGIQTIAGPVDVVVPMNFRNTWSAALGATYQLSTAWQWKVGVAYDQSPTNDQDREPRLPDSDRREVATGFHYQANKSLGFDAGYMHIYARPTQVNKTTSLPLDDVTTIGSFANSSDVFGLQVTWKFV